MLGWFDSLGKRDIFSEFWVREKIFGYDFG